MPAPPALACACWCCTRPFLGPPHAASWRTAAHVCSRLTPPALTLCSAPAAPLPGCVRAGKEQQLLRAKALECVSLVGLAVGKERFG